VQHRTWTCIFCEVLCGVVCGMGDVKLLEDSICNAGNVCSRASVEEEVAIPGHYSILKVDGGRINRIVLKVYEQNVDAFGARGARTYLAVVRSLRD
jgi:hypothetical protein